MSFKFPYYLQLRALCAPAKGDELMKTNVFCTGLLALTLCASGTAIAKDKQQVKTHPTEMMIYQQSGYNGDDYMVQRANTSITLDWDIGSIAIPAGERWEVCLKPRYQKPCQTLTESLPDSSVLGITGVIRSARMLAPAGK
jgi:hypothetical protein